jgi:outer membrane protein OmpA-like peptidoglycan-associated protein
VTSFVLSADAVVVSGYAPTNDERTAVVALATSAFRGRTVLNQVQIGAGQHDGWSSCLETAVDALRRLKTGRAELTGRSLRVSGVTDSDQTVAGLPDEVRRRAGSNCDTDVSVALDPAAVAVAQAAEAERQAAEEARRRAEAERQTADAQRTEAERTAAEARRRDEEARRLAEEQKRRDEQIARERQEAERQRAEAEQRRRDEEARRLAEEQKRRDEQIARESQRAEAEQRRRDQERQKQAAVPTPPVTERPRTGNPVVDACQDALSKVTREGTINFKRASFDLDPDSFTTLNRLAIAANDCPDLIVEIEGHTDSEGTPERNQRLSNRRADAVKDYLVKAGVSVSRLIAIGYGQSRNIATNDTAAGRAQNRRIEFVVKMRGDR